ncbi:MAG: D-aminoacyl-tRNA deacylase [Candidatus Bipolaricaulota bacterium]|nr:D-aminoacyl-tRNA deacylase [Candidatus Bipolaricaulota bacterium]MDW8030305.1 D-aminoacyl-tRNA deacylase [Candidatus Bipolaricaulota bacterium]
MRLVLQRVREASVEIDGKTVGRIGPGLLIFLGVGKGDSEHDTIFLADRVLGLRIFEDAAGKMNLSVKDVQGEILVVSQFTLYGDTQKGRRPSFDAAAPPDQARVLYELFLQELRRSGLKVESGIFGARMKVFLINDGPVTFILESKAVAQANPT